MTFHWQYHTQAKQNLTTNSVFTTLERSMNGEKKEFKVFERRYEILIRDKYMEVSIRFKTQTAPPWTFLQGRYLCLPSQVKHPFV